MGNALNPRVPAEVPRHVDGRQRGRSKSRACSGHRWVDGQRRSWSGLAGESGFGSCRGCDCALLTR
eukprot:2010481-Alexandrium_andersonii.AAC.1